MKRPTIQIEVKNTIRHALDATQERYAFHRVVGLSQVKAYDAAFEDVGRKKVGQPATYENNALVQLRMAELQAEMSERTTLDYEWLIGEAVKQYRKADTESGVAAIRTAQAGLDQITKLLGIDVTKIAVTDAAGEDIETPSGINPMSLAMGLAEVLTRAQEQKAQETDPDE